jgi:putative exporter of polyketide antibiotics
LCQHQPSKDVSILTPNDSTESLPVSLLSGLFMLVSVWILLALLVMILM